MGDAGDAFLLDLVDADHRVQRHVEALDAGELGLELLLRRVDDDLRAPLATDKPVLLLSGSADPVTPPHFAALAAVEMSNARHLIGENQGHGLAGQGCIPDIVGRFVESASIDDLQTECMQRLFAMPFFLNYSSPAP